MHGVMDQLCTSCHSPRSETLCGVCQAAVCRKCRVFLSDDEFPLVAERPAELKHTYYCGPCSDEKIEPFRARYETILEQARDVSILFKGSKSVVRVLRKAHAAAKVEGALDRDDAILRLAFLAASEGYNAVVEVAVASRKLRNEGYQKSAWSGQGIPSQIHSRELDR